MGRESRRPPARRAPDRARWLPDSPCRTQAWGLLAYLAIEPRPTRTALIDLLFGEADDPSGGVQYRKFWVDEADGKVFCLVEAPDAETAATVHREAHGLVADKIYLVREG